MTARAEDTKRRLAKRRVAVVLAGGLAGAAAGLAAVYGIAALARNAATEPDCRPTVELVKRVAPLARGEVAALAVAAKPSRIPDLIFRDGEGRERTLAEWRGRTVLLNLWATWCAPCRKEMPALDQLQAKLGGPDFEVVAVNIDTRALDKPKAWLSEVGVNRLAYYADPSARIFQDLKSIGRAFGMPTTLLLDPNGCEIGHLAGPAEWASDDAVKLVRAALAK
jgi:thiol-disulfide isomerase/thioredoxin